MRLAGVLFCGIFNFLFLLSSDFSGFEACRYCISGGMANVFWVWDGNYLKVIERGRDILGEIKTYAHRE